MMSGKEGGPGRHGGAAKKVTKRAPYNATEAEVAHSIKSQSLVVSERALTEFGSNFEPRRDSLISDASMNTQQNCAAMEQ